MNLRCAVEIAFLAIQPIKQKIVNYTYTCGNRDIKRNYVLLTLFRLIGLMPNSLLSLDTKQQKSNIFQRNERIIFPVLNESRVLQLSQRCYVIHFIKMRSYNRDVTVKKLTFSKYLYIYIIDIKIKTSSTLKSYQPSTLHSSIITSEAICTPIKTNTLITSIN